MEGRKGPLENFRVSVRRIQGCTTRKPNLPGLLPRPRTAYHHCLLSLVASMDVDSNISPRSSGRKHIHLSRTAEYREGASKAREIWASVALAFIVGSRPSRMNFTTQKIEHLPFWKGPASRKQRVKRTKVQFTAAK
uniref:Uncharacterized protein n=1 Tax=Bionectria ochroleuca TaxID=29856 RepID=A0A8H7TQA0_BIOOC